VTIHISRDHIGREAFVVKKNTYIFWMICTTAKGA